MGKTEKVQEEKKRGDNRDREEKQGGGETTKSKSSNTEIESWARETVGGRQRNGTKNTCSQSNCTLRGSLILLPKGLKTTSVDTKVFPMTRKHSICSNQHAGLKLALLTSAPPMFRVPTILHCRRLF